MSRPTRTIRFVAKEDSKVRRGGSTPCNAPLTSLHLVQIYYGQPVQTDDIGLLYHAKSLLTAHTLSASPLSPTCVVTSTLRTVARLLSPLTGDEIKTIRGLGAQFPAPGTKAVKPEVPVLFYKPVTSISGPEDPIIIPVSARGMNNDYEVELCVVLGKTALNVSVEKALDYVGWYCTSNDVSAPSRIVSLCLEAEQLLRRFLLVDSAPRGCSGASGNLMIVGPDLRRRWPIALLTWGTAWCPIGPCLVARDQIKNPQNLSIKTTVNGITRQLSNTSQMVLSVVGYRAYSALRRP